MLRLENNIHTTESYHMAYTRICVRLGSGVKFGLESKFGKVDVIKGCCFPNLRGFLCDWAF